MAIAMVGGLAYVLKRNRSGLAAVSLLLAGASLNLVVFAVNGYMPEPSRPGTLWYLGDFYTHWLFSVGDLTVFVGLVVLGAAVFRGKWHAQRSRGDAPP